MKYRTLGRTGIKVSEISLGGLFVSSIGAARDDARKAIHRAVELGINYIDTAPGYHDSEESVGHALRDIDTPLVISTKLGGRPTPFDARDKAALRRSFEESLRLLGRDTIDILMIHEPDRPGQYDWFTNWDNFTGPVTDLLEELKAEGLIRFTGLGGTTAYTLPHIIATGRFDVVLTAFNYSLLWQEATISVLPEAKKHGLGVVIGSPLQQGALARCYTETVEKGTHWLSPPRQAQFKALYRLVEESAIPLPELALRFVLSNPDVSTTLSGARSAEEVELNVAAAEKGALPEDVLKEIARIAGMVPFRPFEEPFGLPFTREYRGPGQAMLGHV